MGIDRLLQRDSYRSGVGFRLKPTSLSITAFQSIAFQELLLKLESHFGFGSIKLCVVGGPRTNLETNRQKELRSCREAGHLLDRLGLVIAKPKKPECAASLVSLSQLDGMVNHGSP